jgi:enterobacteria phage integrase
MTPKGRRPGNTDLAGTNIKINRHASGAVYYSYVLPNGRSKSLGKDKAAALTAAAVLNEQFARRPDLIAKVRAAIEPQTVVANDPPLSWLIGDYREKRLALQRYSERSRQEIEYKLSAYDRHWGERRIQSITVLDIATFLNARSGHAQKKHRQLLRELFQFACHQGFRADNPASATMEPIVPPKKRTRHTLEALDAMRVIAPDYLVRAINLALHSLQRRGDLIRMMRSAVNLEQNTLQVLQEKTRNYPTPVFIEIDMHPELQEAVRACLAAPIACPYLLSYKPKRLLPKQQQKKPHHFAMSEAFISHEFARIRDDAKVYEHLAPGERPSFHDLRALGIKMVTDKYGKGYAMALAGHADERMWRHYIEGHEAPKPVRVSFR